MILVTVQYELAESGNFITDADEGTGLNESLDFSGGIKEVTWTIDITSDTSPEDDGTITLTLTPDTASEIKYTVAHLPQ